MKKVLYVLFVIPVSALAVFTVIYLLTRSEPIFSTKSIKITGIRHLSEGEIMEKASPYLKESLFKIESHKINEAISAHPHVKEVRIKRVFPFSLVIDVTEKKPSAFWVNNDGEIHVLDDCGEPFRKMIKGDAKNLLVINAKEKKDARHMFEAIRAWSTEGVVEKDVVSEIVYNDGSITVFGHDDAVEIMLGKEDQRERLKRALAILEDARRRGLLIRSIDARFEKGAIIQERKG